MDITVRQGDFRDWDWIVACQMEMAKETENLILDAVQLKEGVKKVLDQKVDGFYCIAEHKGERTGMLMILKEWSDWRNGEVLWIHSVWVEKNWRKNKVFKSLYEYIKSLVQANPKYRGIRLFVDKTNDVAMRVYKQLGMDGEHYRMFEWMKP